MHAFAAVLAVAGVALAQSSGTGVLPKPTGTAVVITTVTVCPTPTTFVCEGTTYSATTPSQTVTLTCNYCQISPVPTAPVTKTAPAPTAPATYTGAAARVQMGGAALAAAIGLLAL